MYSAAARLPLSRRHNNTVSEPIRQGISAETYFRDAACFCYPLLPLRPLTDETRQSLGSCSNELAFLLPEQHADPNGRKHNDHRDLSEHQARLLAESARWILPQPTQFYPLASIPRIIAPSL